MDKKTREDRKKTMEQCLVDSRMFLNDMDEFEIEAAGFSFKNALNLDMGDVENNAYTVDIIADALKRKIDAGSEGTDTEFAESYSTMLFAVRMLYTIHEHTRILDWYARKESIEESFGEMEEINSNRG